MDNKIKKELIMKLMTQYSWQSEFENRHHIALNKLTKEIMNKHKKKERETNTNKKLN